MTEAPSEPPLSYRKESDVDNTSEKITTEIASSSSEKLSKIGDSSKHTPLPQKENCDDGNDHSSEVNDESPSESPSAPSEKSTNASEMSDCINGSKENILSSVASTEKPQNGATKEYDKLDNEIYSFASDLSTKIEGGVTQNYGDAKDKICDKTQNEIPSQALVVSPKKSAFIASLKTTPSTKVDKTTSGDVGGIDQLANKPNVLSLQQRFEEKSYPWKSTMPTNEDKTTKPSDIKLCDQNSNRRKSAGGGSFTTSDSNTKQDVFGSAKLKVSPRNAQNNYKRKRNSKIVDLSLSKDEDSQETSSKFPSSTKKRRFSSESEHRTTRSQTANRVLSTMDNNKPKKRKSNERINNAPTSVFRPSTYTTQSTSHPASFSPENDNDGSKSQSPRIDAINPAPLKSESKINGEIIIRNCHKDMPDSNLIAHNRNDKNSLTVQETYIKENSKTDLKLTKESKSKEDINKDAESDNTKNTNIKINEEKKESNESMKTTEEKGEEINSKNIQTIEERSNDMESKNAHKKDTDVKKAVANVDDSTESKQRETNSKCVLTKVSKLNHVNNENARSLPQCTSVVKKMTLVTSTKHGIEKEDDEDDDDDDDADMDISQLSHLDQVKTELYLNAVKEHRGKGAERLFSQYWHILGRYLSYPKSIQGSKSAGHRSSRVEKFLKYFLKSRSLKRLHNELILVITKQTMLSHVSKEQFERHVPVPWKRKIRKRNDILVSTTLTSDLNAPCEAEDDRNIKPKSINDINMKHEEEEFNVQRFKREFGVASRVWTVYGDESRSIPGAQESQSLQSNLMSQNESEANIFETDFHSARLPGALAVDPVVRRIAHNEGMSVSENAVWFVVIALREYVSAVLRQALTNAVEVGVQDEPEVGQNGSDDVTLSKDINAEKHMMASSGKVATLEDKTNDTKRKHIITSLDLAQAIASNPLLGGGSRNSCSSRLAWERCISSARDNMHSTSSIDLLKLQKRISNEIDVESFKRRKIEVEVIEAKEREARLKKEKEEREERLKREKAEREERIKRGKAERDARLKREKAEREEKARREKAEKDERERIMREERTKREKAERMKSLTTTFSVDRARSVPLTNTASNTGQSQIGARRRRSSSSQSVIETKSPQKSGPVKPTLPSIPKAASVEHVSKGNGSLPQATGNKTTNSIASNKSTAQNSDSPTPKPIPRGRGRGVKDLSTLRAASTAGPGPVSTPAQTPNERIAKTNASEERPAMARQLQNMSGRGTGVKDLAALRARRLAIESSRNTPASTTEHQNSQEESNAGKNTHQRQNSIGSTGTDMRLPSMNSFVSSQRSQGEQMTVQGDQVMIGDIPKRGMGEKQLMLLRKAEERRRVEEKQDEKLTSNKNKTKKAVGAVS